VSEFNLVEALGSDQGVEYLVGYPGLTSLLQPAVVTRTQSRSYGHLFTPAAWHLSGTWESLDVRLGRAQPVALGTQKCSKLGAVWWHVFTICGNQQVPGVTGWSCHALATVP
jgi:hypothetical protein